MLMTDVPRNVLTTATLRTAIRAKIREGVSPRAISTLINDYAPDAPAGRIESGVQRRAVELIPPGQRVDFLVALNELQDDLPRVTTKIDYALVGFDW
jgi:hypothetical protein